MILLVHVVDLKEEQKKDLFQFLFIETECVEKEFLSNVVSTVVRKPLDYEEEKAQARCGSDICYRARVLKSHNLTKPP